MEISKFLSRLLPDTLAAPVSGEEADGMPIQTGALPWRISGDKRAEVLLVTGRRSGRWMIPKGWPMPGKSLAKAAEREAYEEAGVEGTVDPTPLGSFEHLKQNALGSLKVSILVHTMAVKRELSEWPEHEQRQRKWFKLKDAAESVDSEELRALILDFRQRVTAKP